MVWKAVAKATIGILLLVLLGCDANQPGLAQMQEGLQKVFHQKDKGVGLTRKSFGPLNTAELPAAISPCNTNVGLGIDKWALEHIAPIFDKPRTMTGTADETLKKEELNNFFKLTAAPSPLVRIISRTPRSIDFWFMDDAVRHAYEATQAAEDFCRGRGKRHARYVGFSFQCGRVVQVPFSINGQQSQVREEELITAYDCM